MKGNLFTGGNNENWDRVEHDYYATPPQDTQLFLENYNIKGFKRIRESLSLQHISNLHRAIGQMQI